MKALLAALAVVAVFTAAQADEPRERAVWIAAHDRITPQKDKWFDDGDYPRCIQLLRIEHELYPHDYTTTTDLGWMLGNVEEPDQELALYKAYRLAYPKDPEAAYPEGEFYYMKKKFDLVPAIIAPTLGKKPHPNSYRILAHAYERLGKYAEAKAVWEKLIADYPDEPAIARTRGELKRDEEKLQNSHAPK